MFCICIRGDIHVLLWMTALKHYIHSYVWNIHLRLFTSIIKIYQMYNCLLVTLSDWVKDMVLNATFNNIWIILWWSVVLVEETGVPGESHRPATSHWLTLSHNVVSNTTRHEWDLNSQLKWWWALIAQIVVHLTTIVYDDDYDGRFSDKGNKKWYLHWK